MQEPLTRGNADLPLSSNVAAWFLLPFRGGGQGEMAIRGRRILPGLSATLPYEGRANATILLYGDDSGSPLLAGEGPGVRPGASATPQHYKRH